MTLCPVRLDIDPLPASPLPVSLDLIKAHCAVDFTDQDELLETYLLAAITSFEDTTHRTVFSCAHRWTLKDFPQNRYQQIRLPRGKTQSVQKIDFVQGGQTVTLTGASSSPASDDYQEDLRGDDGGTLMPPRGGSWPSVEFDNPAPVTIHFTAGWQTAELPPNLLNALLFAVRISLDDMRGSVDPTRHSSNLETLEALVSGFRLTRFY